MKNPADKDSNLVVKGLLGFLSEKGKTGLLPSVTDLLTLEVDKKNKAREIVITGVIQLDKTEVREIGRLVSGFLNRDLPIVAKVDKSLLGGFTIRVGDFFLDASLASEMAKIKKLILS